MERITLLKNHLSSQTPKRYTKVQTETLDDGKIGVISLNSPKDLNALSKELKTEIVDALQVFSTDKKVRVIILRTELPKAFCAGASIAEFPLTTLETQNLADIFEDIEYGFERCKKPIIAAINGVALGGGFEVALACDMILMSEEARLGLPELRLGLIPGIGGTQRLAKLVGKHNAMKIILSGQFVSADEAYRLGICQGVYKKENLYNEAVNLARSIADKPTYALILGKKAIKYADEVGLTQGLRFEREEINALFSSQGKQEGVSAFLEKRKPNFEDK